jgi:glucose-6-phosphate isomerase
LCAAAGEDCARALPLHFVAVTSDVTRAAAFGLPEANVFKIWDWVGGRYSLWSAVGLPIALSIGMNGFERLLAGAQAMDTHFREAPFEKNLPVLMALIGIWNTNFLGAATSAVLPYHEALRFLPSFLQQLEMESNGKRVRRDGSMVDRGTCPVVFGEPGTNGQHAFFQQIHQGPETVPAEFVVVAKTDGDAPESPLWANALAQAQALMLGKTAQEARAEMLAAGLDPAEADRLAPHRAFPGNRPSTTIVMDRVTPQSLGALLALYEHKTFVEGVLWDINSFDQWGVELGKVLAKAILKDVETGGPSADLDPSTAALMTRLMR